MPLLEFVNRRNGFCHYADKRYNHEPLAMTLKSEMFAHGWAGPANSKKSNNLKRNIDKDRTDSKSVTRIIAAMVVIKTLVMLLHYRMYMCRIRSK